jgi:mRNA-degrading endonuclease RelE of RelBE toxin-antitoxin system
VTQGAYQILWSGPAQRALRRLPEKVALAVVEFVYGSLAANPQRLGKPLRLEVEGLHSAPRGDYRIIYSIEADTLSVQIEAVEHRSDVYRSRG